MASSVCHVPCKKMYQRKRKGCRNCQDLISSLMDDILVRILSLLDLREAARTCVLSKRWRYVWAYLSDLDFNSSSTFYTLWTARSISKEQYVTWVNQVVSSSRAPVINRFRVHFPLGLFYGYNIQKWVNFAMGKNVAELELNFSCYNGGCPKPPFYLDSFRRYVGYLSVHSLVSLSLRAVSISGYFLESVLSNFTNLERLTMKNVYCGHSNLNVVGDLLKLRYLEITSCYDYSKLEISARNLISFVYCGFKHEVNFSYVPLLKEASFSGSNPVCWLNSLHHSGFLSQLTKLELSMLLSMDFIDFSVRLPQFINLKQLEFTIYDVAPQSFLILTDLIHACPVLHKFKLQRFFSDMFCPIFGFVGRDSSKFYDKHHHCLKIFEMVGFRGTPADIELVLYLGRCAIMLEKVILDPHRPGDEGKPSEFNTREQIEVFRKEAKLLQNQLPLARVQVEFL